MIFLSNQEVLPLLQIWTAYNVWKHKDDQKVSHVSLQAPNTLLTCMFLGMYNLFPLFLRVLDEFLKTQLLELVRAAPFHCVQLFPHHPVFYVSSIFKFTEQNKATNNPFCPILVHRRNRAKQESSVRTANLSRTQLQNCHNIAALLTYHITDNYNNNWNDWVSWLKA
jgi:hypothetical protein